MARKSFNFRADTINGEIQEFPPTMSLFCDRAIPIGVNVVRDFDEDGCGVARRVFLIVYDGQTLGSTQFKSRSEYDQYISVNCECCTELCGVKLGDCFVKIGNCSVLI